MKQFTLALLVLFALCVSACGGGGSGDNAQIIKDHDSIFAAIPTGSSTGLSPGNLTKTADGLRLDTADLFGLASQATARTVDFPSGENSVYRDHGTHIRASVDTPVTLNNEPLHLGSINGNFTGNVVITDTLRLGGMKAGLQYSEFGMWQIDVAFNGTADGTPVNRDMFFLPTAFLLSDPGKVQGFTAHTGRQSFSGLAMAHAWDGNDPGNILAVDLHGTASLTVDTANLATGGSLELSFADFYNFQISGLDVASDSFGRYGTLVITPNGTNTTGIVFSPGDLDGYAGGFFYGATTPEEAVGEFYFPDGANKNIFGVFGVVKQTQPQPGPQ